MKVSVILPSLNVKEYIAECLESVVCQTLKDIEIICVDAGSTDGTLEVIRKYEKHDERVKLIISDKKSYGYQMNLGIDHAHGEYIGIVETDDYVPSDMYESLYDIATENDVDLVKADFYRFTGKGETLSRAYHRLSADPLDYNRVVDIAMNQKYFDLVMNTWSGIYKRSFLLENGILHNETPGASYQDNGFWFQTLMYAKRALFVDKPFYMNRRDNENSSVFSKGKVYCICDEYSFIYHKLKENRALWRTFGSTFAGMCFRAYHANLNRIADEYKKDFIRKWSEDFRIFRDEGIINFRRFNEVDWEMLLDIITDPDGYYERKVLNEELFYKEVRRHSNIIIYGAGMIGHRVFDKLKYCGEPADVICFAVSNKNDNYESYKGVPIRPIEELGDHKDTGYFVVATTARYQNEIRDTLTRNGYKNIALVPEKTEKGQEYYKNLSGEERETELADWFLRTTGKVLSLHPPVTSEDKQQWMKLYDNSEVKRFLSDKINARNWAAGKLGEEYLTDLFGVYDSADEIPFDELPERFIIKCTHGSRMNTFVECRSLIDRGEWERIKRKVNSDLKVNFAYQASMEMFYENVKPRIMIEIPLETGNTKSDNYKIVCRNGSPCIIISERRKQKVETHTRDAYDVNWNHQEYESKYPNSDVAWDRPDNLGEMLDVAKSLAEGFDFAVIHLFNISGEIKFNEIKFLLDSGV